MINLIKPLFIDRINESWINHLRELHWSGKLMTWLGKGYATFAVTEHEKSKWNLSQKDVNRIKEVLQSEIDVSNAKTKINDFLSCLSSYEYIYVPNKLKNTTIVDEIRKDSEEHTARIEKQVTDFLEPIMSENYLELLRLFKKWEGQYVQTILKKAGLILANKLFSNGIILEFPNLSRFELIAEEIQHFLLLVYYYSNKIPDSNRISLFKELLQKKKEKLTSSIDFILVDSWKQFPDLMYQLTQSWIESLNPILIDWLIHGVENPGRVDPYKALNFLKPAFSLNNNNVAWIISHVTSTIICADPYQALNILDDWLQEKKSIIIKERLKTSLLDIIVNKFEHKNYDDYDFPDLETIITKIMTEWSKRSGNHLEIGSLILGKISE